MGPDDSTTRLSLLALLIPIRHPKPYLRLPWQFQMKLLSHLLTVDVHPRQHGPYPRHSFNPPITFAPSTKPYIAKDARSGSSTDHPTPTAPVFLDWLLSFKNNIDASFLLQRSWPQTVPERFPSLNVMLKTSLRDPNPLLIRQVICSCCDDDLMTLDSGICTPTGEIFRIQPISSGNRPSCVGQKIHDDLQTN